MQKALGALSGAVPGLGGKKSSRSMPGFGGKRTSSSGTRAKGGKAGGVALLTAAAGLAFQNRDKLTSKLRKDRSDRSSTPPDQPSTPPATTGTPTL